MVGGLVHQEDVGLGGQLAGDGEALLPAPGERGHLRATVGEPGPAERVRDASGTVGLVDRAQRGGDHILDGAAGREDGILRHVPHAHPAAHRATSAIG